MVTKGHVPSLRYLSTVCAPAQSRYYLNNLIHPPLSPRCFQEKVMKFFNFRSRRGVGSAVLFAFVCSSVVWAGDVGTRLRCTVTDQTKAYIGQAQLTLKSSNSSFSATGASNEQGEYSFINVPPGTYELTVEKDGFSPEKVENVRIDLNEVRVLNVALSVKAVSEIVEISSHGEKVSVVPQQTFLRGLVDPLRMRELPLNGRNFADLIYTQPGVVRDSSGSLGTGQSVDGGRTTSNNFLVNDSDTNDPRIPLLPGLNINTSGIPLDALDEFRAMTTNATAEYGRSSGAIVNVATKSGAEKLHGSLWEFFRNDVLDAKGFFDANGKKEPFKQNQFGGRLGGAFKKTFYSGAYEGFRQRELVSTNALVPTPSFLASVFNPAWKSLLQGLHPAPNQPFAPGAVVGVF